MNDDIFPVTPRITDPDLRPSQYRSDQQYNQNDQGALIEFEQDQPHSTAKQRNTNAHHDDVKKSSGFNVFGFNLTYKHIIIIVLVVIALLIVIYLVVNWMRKSNTNEPVGQYVGPGGGQGPPNGAQGPSNGAQGQPNRPQRPPQVANVNQRPRSHPDAGKSESELAALLQQSQNKLNELNNVKTNEDNNDEQPTDAQAEETQTDDAPTHTAGDVNTHMEIPQEQIDNILSTGDDE
ncbi:hypothetical protein D5b_00090 [Faustovirus]|nr:hypothetical protein D5b_00090 [Faustovirus]AMN84820.1 hypothetical protein D6_00420 [Faustovirus]AMP44048.1 hypothetical protein PRJ_Dakar_00089 [Faustovirus]QKE50502.1 hypothetical protein F-VV10_0382 [Faustovirus]